MLRGLAIPIFIAWVLMAIGFVIGHHSGQAQPIVPQVVPDYQPRINDQCYVTAWPDTEVTQQTVPDGWCHSLLMEDLGCIRRDFEMLMKPAVSRELVDEED